MSELKNLNSITLNGVFIDDIPQNYNPYVDKEQALVTQKVLEQTFKLKETPCDYEFNKKHSMNVIYNMSKINEFDELGLTTDDTYGMKFKKVDDNTFAYPSDFASEIKQDVIYLTDKISTNTETYMLHNFGFVKVDNTYVVERTEIAPSTYEYTFKFTVEPNAIYKLDRSNDPSTTFFTKTEAEFLYDFEDLKKYFHKKSDCSDVLDLNDTEILTKIGDYYNIYNTEVDLYFKSSEENPSFGRKSYTKTPISLDKYGYNSKTKTVFMNKLVKTDVEIDLHDNSNIKKIIVSETCNYYKFKCPADSHIELIYPKLKSDSILSGADNCSIYMRTPYDEFYVGEKTCSIKCDKFYMSSNFFKSIPLTAETEIFGDFSSITVNELYIEEDGLNTPLEGAELIDLLKNILKISGDFIKLY